MSDIPLCIFIDNSVSETHQQVCLRHGATPQSRLMRCHNETIYKCSLLSTKGNLSLKKERGNTGRKKKARFKYYRSVSFFTVAVIKESF